MNKLEERIAWHVRCFFSKHISNLGRREMTMPVGYALMRIDREFYWLRNDGMTGGNSYNPWNTFRQAICDANQEIQK